jgi:hypothetical protein
MLEETERSTGALGSIVTGTTRVLVKDTTPTLAELGLTKKKSARAQLLADLPEDEFEIIKAGEVSNWSYAAEAERQSGWKFRWDSQRFRRGLLEPLRRTPCAKSAGGGIALKPSTPHASARPKDCPARHCP